jgi:hypothetical protein
MTYFANAGREERVQEDALARSHAAPRGLALAPAALRALARPGAPWMRCRWRNATEAADAGRWRCERGS